MKIFKRTYNGISGIAPVSTKYDKVIETIVVGNKELSKNQVVELIHEEFDTRVDILLKELEIPVESPIVDKKLLDKRRYLIQLGFSESKGVKDVSEQVQKVSQFEKQVQERAKLKEAISYFKTKYALYKFIRHEDVVEICNKYSLVLGEADWYIGDIPEKNILDMLNFKIDDEDVAWVLRSSYTSGTDTKMVDYKTAQLYINRQTTISAAIRTTAYYGHTAAFKIVANVKDFNLAGKRVEGIEIKQNLNIPDPIVLKPVMYNDKMYYLIVTAWGEEASDPLVVNEINN